MLAEFISLPDFLLALAIVMAAGLVRGYSGFGSGLVIAPLVTLLWGPVEAVAISSTVGAFAFMQLVPANARIAHWREIGVIVTAALIVTPVGTYFLVSLDPSLVKRLIGMAVLVATLITMGGWTYKGPRGFLPSTIAGVLGGLINGVASVGGPPVVLYLMSLPETARIHRANIAMAIGLMGFFVMIFIWLSGAPGIGTAVRIGLLVLPFAFGVWAGTRLFHRLPGDTFRRIVLWMLVVISISIIIY